MTLEFVKMQGIGNDFVVVDCLPGGAPSEAELQVASVRLCDRRFGIGGDGVLVPDRRLQDADVQPGRQRGRDVRQRHPLLRQVRV